MPAPDVGAEFVQVLQNTYMEILQTLLRCSFVLRTGTLGDVQTPISREEGGLARGTITGWNCPPRTTLKVATNSNKVV